MQASSESLPYKYAIHCQNPFFDAEFEFIFAMETACPGVGRPNKISLEEIRVTDLY